MKQSKKSTKRNDSTTRQVWSRILKLPITSKTVGVLDGVHLSYFKGMGHDFEDFRNYQPGDNPRDIEWRSSARVGAPVIKRFRANANTNLALILDSSKEMITRASSGERKIDIVHTVCETFGYLSSMRLDAVGIIAGDENRIMNERARLRYGEIHGIISKVESISSDLAPHRSYLRVLAFANSFFQKRTFLVLVFDEATIIQTGDEIFSVIRRLQERHDIFVVTIKTVNPFARKLPKIQGKVIDIDTHNFVPAYFRQEVVERIAKKSIGINRKYLGESFRKLGVPHINVASSDEFFTKMSRIMRRREVKNL